jgi:hypothetical protein
VIECHLERVAQQGDPFPVAGRVIAFVTSACESTSGSSCASASSSATSMRSTATSTSPGEEGRRLVATAAVDGHHACLLQQPRPHACGVGKLGGLCEMPLCLGAGSERRGPGARARQRVARTSAASTSSGAAR